MSPKNRRRAAGLLVVLTIVGWPLTVVFTSEPPWILSLSWAALTLTALDILGDDGL